MTLTELIKHLRVSILDDTGGTGIDWTAITDSDVENESLRWSNEELTTFINEAVGKVCSSTGYLQDIQAGFQIALVAGTAIYSIDPRIIRIKHNKLTDSGLPLTILEMEDVEDISNWIDLEGRPYRMIVDYTQGQIVINPTPVANDTLDLWTVRHPMVACDWASPTEDNTELPPTWQIPMLSYAAHLAYSKDESNALDPEAAEKQLARFINEFSFTSAYSQKRRVRSRGRTVKYGGL